MVAPAGAISDITQQINSRYLREANLGNNVLQLGIMGGVDVGALLELAQAFPANSLMCPRANITRVPTVQQWVDGIKHGRTVTVLALKNDPGDSSSEKTPDTDLAEHVYQGLARPLANKISQPGSGVLNSPQRE